MAVQQVDLAQPILNALLQNAVVVDTIATYMEGWSIFTRRPPPPDAPYPMIVISSDISKDNSKDGYFDQRPMVTRDVLVYGTNDTAAHYLAVEKVAYSIFDQFYRHPHQLLLQEPGWVVYDIVARGPLPAPAADDEHVVGRVVPLEVHLAIQD